MQVPKQAELIHKFDEIRGQLAAVNAHQHRTYLNPISPPPTKKQKKIIMKTEIITKL